LESGWQEVVLIGLLSVVLLVESSFVLFEIFIEHILATQLVPSSEMVDPHMRQYSMLLEYPIHLLLLAPDYIPIFVPCLLPLSVLKSIIDAIFE
jgi:hypothetical protein